jgi:signal transduction histidine kinase
MTGDAGRAAVDPVAVAEDPVAALDLVPEAVVVLTPAGTVLHTNDRAPALLDIGPGAVGRSLDDVLVLRDDGGNRCGVPSGVRPGTRLAERILRAELPDGRHRPVSMAGRALDDGRLVLTFRSAGRRERVDATRSDLVATVSHEIRSPLTSVKGFTRTLLTKWDRFSDDQKRAMLETVNEDADRVTRLLRELLDVSRIDAGRVQLHRQPVDIGQIARAVADKAAHRPEGRDRTITVDVEPDTPPVNADPDKVEQIVTNLVENALHYAPGSVVELTVARTAGDVRITVADHGPGIPADQVRRIFEKFGRARAQRRAGTGLGLYITRGLVVAHGGSVWCTSAEGEGAVFHVSLPIGQPGV